MNILSLYEVITNLVPHNVNARIWCLTEKILVGDKVCNQIIAKDFGYIVRNSDALQSEQTATIMWGAFEKYKYYPLLWNAFPFHPYKSGNLTSNRIPNRNELAIGRTFIIDLINLYDIKNIYPVGNAAEARLNKLGINNQKLRHPANGGKLHFIKGLEQIIYSENLRTGSLI